MKIDQSKSKDVLLEIELDELLRKQERYIKEMEKKWIIKASTGKAPWITSLLKLSAKRLIAAVSPREADAE